MSCALGVALGLFPILGSTTALCFLAALILRLNQPAMQAVNYVVYPAQLALFPVFVRAGEALFGAEPVPVNPAVVMKEFAAGIGPFLSKYGMAGLYGIAVWMLAAPVLVASVFFPLAAVFERVKRTPKEPS